MEYTCTLCKNTNQFVVFVKYFKETYEEIREKGILNDPGKYGYIHLRCSAFHPELEVGIYRKPLTNMSDKVQEKDVLVETILHSGKNLKQQSGENCKICGVHNPRLMLIQCGFK